MSTEQRRNSVSVAINSRDIVYDLLSKQVSFLANDAKSSEHDYLVYEAQREDELMLDTWTRTWRRILIPDFKRLIPSDPLFDELGLYVFSTYDHSASLSTAHVQADFFFSTDALEYGYSRSVYEWGKDIGELTRQRVDQYGIVAWTETEGKTENTRIRFEDFRSNLEGKIHLGSLTSGLESVLAAGGDDDIKSEKIFIDLEMDLVERDILDDGIDIAEIIISQALLSIYDTFDLQPSAEMQLTVDYENPKA